MPPSPAAGSKRDSPRTAFSRKPDLDTKSSLALALAAPNRPGSTGPVPDEKARRVGQVELSDAPWSDARIAGLR